MPDLPTSFIGSGSEEVVQVPLPAKQALKWCVSAGDRVLSPPGGVVVLIYHRVGGGSALDVDLPASEFAIQMESLAATGRVVSLDRALDQLNEEAPPSQVPPGPGPIVVTFDDGTADFADVAFPILTKFGIPATLYLATEFIDEARHFPNDGIPLSWTAVREVHESPLVTIGSHTHTHALLDRLAPAAIEAELDRADELIEEHLGSRPEHFAYPKAVAGSSSADAAVRRRYRSAALAGTRANPFGRTDPHRLARSPIQCSDGMRYFDAKTRGGMHLEDDLRRFINRWRYRDATG